jgi:predicted SnoaL-like aldol condensation-catalyzing enzyme
MSEQNKTIVRRLFEELWNKGNLPVADELIAPTYTHHDAAGCWAGS